MTTLCRTIFAWMLTLLGSIVLLQFSITAGSGDVCDAPCSATKTSVTYVEDKAAVETVGNGECSLLEKAVGEMLPRPVNIRDSLAPMSSLDDVARRIDDSLGEGAAARIN
jgi:hypothetical protein